MVLLNTIKEFLEKESTPLEQRLFVIGSAIITVLSIVCFITSLLLSNSILLNSFWAFIIAITSCYLIAAIKGKYELARKFVVVTTPFFTIPAILLLSRSLSLSIAYSVYAIAIINIFATSRERYIANPVLIIVTITATYCRWYHIELWPHQISNDITFVQWAIEVILILIGSSIVPAYISGTFRSKNCELTELLRTDTLTDLYNKRHLNTQLPQLLNIAQRSKSPLSILAIDIDNFKKYNDNYGHLAGDDALKNVANIFKAVANRSTDSIYRFGGEEFIIILSSTDTAGAQKVSQKIVDSFAQAQIPHKYSATGYITVSIGITTQSAETILTAEKLLKQPDNILKQADTALYESKNNGRNRYSVYKSS